MASNFAKLDNFERVDFRRWQKKRHFLLSNMSVVYVLTTPIPEDCENATMDQIRQRAKWDNDDYVYRGLILNGMSDPLFDIYQNIDSSKELWDSLEAKYMAKDASSNNVVGPSVVNMLEHNNSFRMGLNTMEELARHEEEGWNDPIFLEEGSLNYNKANMEQILGIRECQVDMLMKDVISLIWRSENLCGLSSNTIRQLPPEP
nr:zinc finger, CCHC-type [Tanacetum cinerariifolium]